MTNKALCFVAILCISLGRLPAAEPANLLIAKFTAGQNVKLWRDAAAGVELTVEPLTKQDLNYTLKVVHHAGGWPGIGLPHPPSDWSAYQVFKFEAWAPENISVELRMDDAKSKGFDSRFNFSFKLTKGRNLVQIPIERIRKVIDPKHIVLVMLFMSDPPEGSTIYYDNFRLGPMERDEVHFMPYADRMDLQPTTRVRTPHFPFGRNLSRGPLKIFAINAVTAGRAASELMQRLDMNLNVVTWDRAWDANTWGIADFYGQRGTSSEDCMLVQRYLASSMQSPERLDAMILTTPWGWSSFSESAREGILRRVEKDGTGLVFIMPFPGGAKPVWTDDLRKLCALVDAPSDYFAGGYYGLREPKDGIIGGKPWRLVGRHPITDGVPLDALPVHKIDVMQCKAAAGAQVLIETDSGNPVLAVKQLGKGRVVTLSVRSDGLSPPMPLTPDQRLADGFEFRYWEIWYDLLARAAYWASGSTFSRNGEPVKLAVSGDDTDENLSVRQWKDKAGTVTDWQIDFVKPSLTVVPLLVPEMVDRGADIELGFTPPQNIDKAAKWEVTASEPAVASERILERITPDLTGIHAVKPGSGRGLVSIPTKRMSRTSVHLRVTARHGGRIVAEGLAVVLFTPTQTWEDFEVHSWGLGGLPYMADYELRLGRALGITCAQSGGWWDMREAMVNGFRNQCFLGVDGLNNPMYVWDQRAWNNSKDRQYLIRKPSFADPQEMARRQKDITERVRTFAKYKPLSGILADETSLTSYAAEFDYDMHPANIEAFRRKLQAKFGTIAAMNAALKTSEKSFKEIVAPVTAETKASGNWGLWNEWRAHNDDLWTSVFTSYAAWINAVEPGIRVSVSGTQPSTPFNGIDWAKLTPALRSVTGYNARFQQLQRLNFHPSGDLKSMAWVGYGNKGVGAQYQMWDNLFNGDAGCGFFWWYSLRNPDLTWSQSALDYKVALDRIAHGVGRQYQLARRRFSPIAVLWSPTSQRAAYAAGKFEQFVQEEENVLQSLRRAGYEPYFISEPQLLAGELKAKGARALFLPMTLSLGMGTYPAGVKVWPAIEAFLQQKGLVVCTCMPDRDEFLQPLEAPAKLKQQVVQFKTIGKDLRGALEQRGVKPWVTVCGAGLTAGEMPPYVHELRSAKGAHGYLVGLLLPPASAKRTIGADGVMHEEGGDRAPVACTLEFAGLPHTACYLQRSGQRLTGQDKVVLTAGQGELLSLLPYVVTGVSVDLKAEDQDLVVRWAIKRGDVAADFLPHAVRIEVADAAGVLDPDLARNTTSRADGTGTMRLSLSESEREQRWAVTVRDVLTGIQGQARQP